MLEHDLTARGVAAMCREVGDLLLESLARETAAHLRDYAVDMPKDRNGLYVALTNDLGDDVGAAEVVDYERLHEGLQKSLNAQISLRLDSVFRQLLHGLEEIQASNSALRAALSHEVRSLLQVKRRLRGAPA